MEGIFVTFNKYEISSKLAISSIDLEFQEYSFNFSHYERQSQKCRLDLSTFPSWNYMNFTTHLRLYDENVLYQIKLIIHQEDKCTQLTHVLFIQDLLAPSILIPLKIQGTEITVRLYVESNLRKFIPNFNENQEEDI